MPSSIAKHVIAIILVGCFPACGFAQTLGEEEQRIVDFYLSGMWNAKMQLRSGVFRARAKKTIKSKLYTDHDFFMAFDFEKSWLRFDNDNMKHAGHLTRYARNSTESLLLCTSSDVLTKHDPDWKISLTSARPFDIQKMGIMTEAEFFNTNITYDDYRDLAARREYTEVEEMATGICRITWVNRFDPVNFKFGLWIDSTKGLCQYAQRGTQRSK